MTYNGQNFVEAVAVDDGGNGTGHRKASIWYLTLGSGSAITSTIAVTFTSIVSTTFAGAGSFTNVDQSTPIGNTNTTFGTGTSSSVSVSSSANNAVVDVLAKRQQVTITPGANQSLIFSQNAASNVVGGASFEVATGSSVDMSWSWSGTNETAHAAAELNYISSLPVELTFFKGQTTNEGTFLTWQTAIEENNYGFEVERSTNGQDWETLAFVEGHGTTIETQNYTYTDEAPLTGINYYRLKQIDFDGAFEYSDVVNITMKASNNGEVRLFPNPVSDELNIVNGEGVATIYNALGQPVRELIINNVQSTINVKDLPKGQYILRITQQNGNVVSQQFVK